MLAAAWREICKGPGTSAGAEIHEAGKHDAFSFSARARKVHQVEVADQLGCGWDYCGYAVRIFAGYAVGIYLG